MGNNLVYLFISAGNHPIIEGSASVLSLLQSLCLTEGPPFSVCVELVRSSQSQFIYRAPSPSRLGEVAGKSAKKNLYLLCDKTKHAIRRGRLLVVSSRKQGRAGPERSATATSGRTSRSARRGRRCHGSFSPWRNGGVYVVFGVWRRELSGRGSFRDRLRDRKTRADSALVAPPSSGGKERW